MDLDYASIGLRISKRRKLMHIRQKDLAERINISNNYLSSIEKGKEKPSLDILIHICNELKVTPDYLILGNIHSNNVSQNIIDSLRLCTDEDIDLIYNITQYLVDRRSNNWNDDNYMRLSQTLCKPPAWCRIEAPHRRF